MASLIGAVVGAALGSAVKIAGDLGVNFVQKKLKLWADFEVDIKEIEQNLELIFAQWEEKLLQEMINPCQVPKISFEHMVDLAYEIEDCLDHIRRSSKPNIDRLSLATKAKQLIGNLEKAYQRVLIHNGNPSQSSTTILPPANASSSTWPEPDKLVGINEPLEEILNLLNDIEDQPEQMTKVICIAGFSGTGKSTLANQVYCTDLARQFPCRARVTASLHKGDTNGLLMALIKQIIPQTHHARNIDPLPQIKIHLKNKRYFIVLDDIIDTEQWCNIRSTFPDTRGVIIVTTRDQRVAIACRSDGNGFLYNMRTLNETDSTKYLEASLENKNFSKFKEGSRLFANKCDGHPLSLVSMTKYLLGKEKFTKTDFGDFWNNLSDSMKSDKVFEKLEQILVDSYRTLACNNVRAFLLYLCLFPNGHPIRRKRLTRRWLAEGYTPQLDGWPKELVEQNIVRTLESRKDAAVKCCKVHGIIHGFMVHMSMPAKFIAPADSVNDIDRGKYRHLCFRGGESEESNVGQSDNSQDKNLFRAHSLTICGSAGKKAVGVLRKCNMLRVLDLEECDNLKNDDIKGIHKLWHLKYLSLGATITSLPSKIVELNCLETLDMRKANIKTLPVGIIKLPHLAHLLGKFKLERKRKAFTRWSKLKTSLQRKSNLRTLAGFVTDEDDNDECGFASLMIHMEKLSKVKIWCESTDKHSVGFTALSEAIKKFLKTRLNTTEDGQSLSLYLGNSSKEVLSSLWKDGEIASSYLSSLKLDGALSELTEFSTSLCGLKVLCLSSTNGLTTTDLTNLQKLKRLEYLKLVNVDLSGFEITSEHFPKVLRLCLVQCRGSVPTIGAEALPYLDSLWILDEKLDGRSVIKINIEKHKHLQEVALDSNVEQATITSWDEAARKHPKRPKVLFFECVNSNGTGSMVKYVTTERPVPRRPGKRPGISAESNSVEQQLSSDFHKRLKCDDAANMEEAVAADRSPASTELNDAMDSDVASSSRGMNWRADPDC